MPMVQFHSHLSDKSDQYDSTTATHLCIILHIILTKKMISLFLTTLWDHTDGCANQYPCVSDVYMLSWLALEIYIIIDRKLR